MLDGNNGGGCSVGMHDKLGAAKAAAALLMFAAAIAFALRKRA